MDPEELRGLHLVPAGSLQYGLDQRRLESLHQRLVDLPFGNFPGRQKGTVKFPALITSTL